MPAPMAAEAPLRVIIADDDPHARHLIKRVLLAAGGIVVAEAKNGREAVELCPRYRPDVLIMDVIMPVLDGILATRRILEANPDQLVVVLTGAGEDELGSLAVEAGAVGFLSKDADIGTLTRTLKEVMGGEGPVSLEQSPERVAEMLVISPDTVRSHVENITRELSVHSRADALAAAEWLRDESS